MVVDVTLYARAKLMEEFKAGQHVEWYPNFEIGVWKDKEAELVVADGKGKTNEEPLFPREASPRLIEPTKEVDEPAQVEVTTEEPTQVEVATKEPSVEHEELMHK